MTAVPAFSDEDARLTIVRALRLQGVMAAIVLPLVWWKMGWQSAALFLAGTVISAAGLWKWLRLMSVVFQRMDAQAGGGGARPMGTVLLGFFLTLGLMLVVLYGSLKLLDGSVYALFAGLGLGIAALTFEALRLVKAWTV